VAPTGRKREQRSTIGLCTELAGCSWAIQAGGYPRLLPTMWVTLEASAHSGNEKRMGLTTQLCPRFLPWLHSLHSGDGVQELGRIKFLDNFLSYCLTSNIMAFPST
jgi:hypothetical protein